MTKLGEDKYVIVWCSCVERSYTKCKKDVTGLTEMWQHFRGLPWVSVAGNRA